MDEIFVGYTINGEPVWAHRTDDSRWRAVRHSFGWRWTFEDGDVFTGYEPVMEEKEAGVFESVAEIKATLNLDIR